MLLIKTGVEYLFLFFVIYCHCWLLCVKAAPSLLWLLQLDSLLPAVVCGVGANPDGGATYCLVRASYVLP